MLDQSSGHDYHMNSSGQDCMDMGTQPGSTYNPDPSLSRDPMFSSTASGLLAMSASDRFLNTHKNENLYSNANPPLSTFVSSGHQSGSSLNFSSPTAYNSSGGLGVYPSQTFNLVNSRSTNSHSLPRPSASQSSPYNAPYLNPTFGRPIQAEHLSRMGYEQSRNSILPATGMPLTPTSAPNAYGTSMLSLGNPSPYPAALVGEQRESGMTEKPSLPFNEHTYFHSLVARNGETIRPYLTAKTLTKNVFFSADKCWTCYRRNYVIVQCSFSLDPFTPHEPLYLDCNNKRHQVQAFGVSLSAVADGPSGKPVELVQYTAKRDKGIQCPVSIEKVAPTPPGKSHQSLGEHSFGVSPYHSHHHPQSMLATYPILPFQADQATSMPPPAMYGTSAALAMAAGQSLIGQGQQTAISRESHTYERIQFKSATANNGKRRAQQQYYNLVSELYADIRGPEDSQPNWVKIAQRTSDALVVRGRSPSHYDREGPQSQGRGGAGSVRGGTPPVPHSSRSNPGGRPFSGNGFMNNQSPPSTSHSTGGYRSSQYTPVGHHHQVTMDGFSHDPDMSGSNQNNLSSDDADPKFGNRSSESRGHYYPHSLDGSTPATSQIDMKEDDPHMGYGYDAAPSGSQSFGQTNGWVVGAGHSRFAGDSRNYYADTNTGGY